MTDSLERALAQKRRLEQTLQRQSDLLRERVKELECLQAIARLFDSPDPDLEETLQSVAEVVPRAWQYPDIAQARIAIDGKSYATPGFSESAWCQTATITVRGIPAGSITVCYGEERPARDEGPFLREERALLNMVAQRLSGFVERSQGMQSLLSYQQDLRRLASVLAVSEQRERRRIAEGLHDHIGQNLALASMRLSAAQRLVADQEVARSIAEARDLISEVIAETRSLTFELCPPILYELGLGPALDWVGEQFEGLYGYKVVVREHNPPVQLPDDSRATLFQAAREALINVAKHGRASVVDVDIYNQNGRVEVVIRDNGVGFDLDSLGDERDGARLKGTEGSRAKKEEGGDGFGLFSIRERLRFLGGSLLVDSAPGRGTTVRLVLPLEISSDPRKEPS